MKTSESIDLISAALAKAQGEMTPAVFDQKNSHYKSKYASLTSIMNSVKGPLSKNGLALSHSFVGPRDAMTVVTRLIHSSGQWIEDDGIPLILDKNNMQGLGSATSYARRYGVSAILAVVADEDDDGNAASLLTDAPESKNNEPNNLPYAQDDFKLKKLVSEKQLTRLFAIMHQRTWTNDQVHEVAIAAFGLKESLKELTMTQYDKLVSWVETMSFEQTNEKIQSWLKERPVKGV